MEEKQGEVQNIDNDIKPIVTKTLVKKEPKEIRIKKSESLMGPKSTAPKKPRYERKVPKKLLHDERFAAWIVKSEKNQKALCRFCNCEIAGGVTQLERHGMTRKHLRNINYQNEESNETNLIIQETTTLSKEDESEHDLTTVVYENPKILNPDKESGISREEYDKRTYRMTDHDIFIHKAAQNLSQEEDQFGVFGKYVASEMRTMRSEYLQKKMKRKIQQIIMEITQEEEDNLRIEIYPNSIPIITHQSDE